MNYEEKYNEALEVMRQWIAPCHTKEQLDTLKKSVFPELAESEDEKIRKWLVDYFKEVGKSWIHRDINPEQILTYLEKQKEQKPEIRVKIPKFRVGDIIQHIPLEKWDRTKKIVSIDECGYNYDVSHLGDTVSGGAIGFAFENEYELVEQKPAEWSEEDEKMRNALWNLLHLHYAQDNAQTLVGIEAGKFRSWLKSLRPHWKPSVEQDAARRK